MGFRDYFRPVQSMSIEEARAFMKERSPEDYTLLDVRQEKEYERGHIPGARLLPVGEIQDRFSELDSHKPVIAY